MSDEEEEEVKKEEVGASPSKSHPTPPAPYHSKSRPPIGMQVCDMQTCKVQCTLQIPGVCCCVCYYIVCVVVPANHQLHGVHSSYLDYYKTCISVPNRLRPPLKMDPAHYQAAQLGHLQSTHRLQTPVSGHLHLHLLQEPVAVL